MKNLENARTRLFEKIAIGCLFFSGTQGWLWTCSNKYRVPFNLRNKRPFHHHNVKCVLKSALAEPEEGLGTSSDDDDQAKPKEQELWLDLRDTAIQPSEALAFLQEFLFDENDDKHIANAEETATRDPPETTRNADFRDIQHLVDHVLVNEETFATLVEFGGTGSVLYTTNKGDIAENSKDTQQSFVKGKVLSPTSSGIFDPIAAMEAIQNGGWIFVDPSEDVPTDSVQHYVDQVEGLLQILSVGDTLSLSPSLSLTSSPQQATVAIACPSVSALISIDHCLATQNLEAAGMSQTESGLWLTATTTQDSEQEQVQSSSETLKPTKSMTTALVLPFDPRLWRTALDLKQ